MRKLDAARSDVIGRSVQSRLHLPLTKRIRTLSAHLPEDRRGLPVNRLARRLLAEATAVPALISRGKPLAKVDPQRVAEPFPAMALLSDPALDIRQYLEDLVSIAVNSAQQAEDVSVQAHQAGRKARRGMAVVAGLGAVGVLVGVAGFAASRSSNIRLSELRDEVTALQGMQTQAQDQLHELTTHAVQAEQREASDATPEARVAPAAVVGQPMPPTAAPNQRPVPYYSQPWPDSRPAPRRSAAWQSPPPARAQAVVMPRLFADLGRSFRAIFH